MTPENIEAMKSRIRARTVKDGIHLAREAVFAWEQSGQPGKSTRETTVDGEAAATSEAIPGKADPRYLVAARKALVGLWTFWGRTAPPLKTADDIRGAIAEAERIAGPDKVE
jgi:hypothetical protein